MPLLAMIPVGIFSAITIWFVGSIVCKIVAQLSMRAASGASMVIQVVSAAVIEVVSQVVGIGMAHLLLTSQKAWAPAGALLDRAAGKLDARIEGQSFAAQSEVEDDYADALEVLCGLGQDCTKSEVDQAFKRAIRGAHPDVSGSERLGQIVIAARETVYARRGWSK